MFPAAYAGAPQRLLAKGPKWLSLLVDEVVGLLEIESK